MSRQKSQKEVLEYVKRVASKHHWVLNPNIDGTLDMLIEGLKNNYNKLGYFNCPCRDFEGKLKFDRDICCPCDYAKPDIKEYGHCYCALFFDPSFDFKKPVKMILERRPEKFLE